MKNSLLECVVDISSLFSDSKLLHLLVHELRHGKDVLAPLEKNPPGTVQEK